MTSREHARRLMLILLTTEGTSLRRAADDRIVRREGALLTELHRFPGGNPAVQRSDEQGRGRTAGGQMAELHVESIRGDGSAASPSVSHVLRSSTHPSRGPEPWLA
jgi:hypothetical protein